MSKKDCPRLNPWVQVRRGVGAGALIGASALLLLLLVNVASLPARTVQAAGNLRVEIVAAYNLVVDSNVTSPSTYAPSVATVFGRFCNTGDADLTNVVAYIGNYTDTSTFAPGIYPARRSSDPAFIAQHPALANTGNYAFTHIGGQLGTSDARRFIGTLAPGQCKVQYWHFTYPQCENQGPPWVPDPPPCAGDPVWGNSIKPYDDLWLQFDMWATSAEGSTDNETWTMTMRNEISAMANKIKPNPDGQWFNTKSDIVEAGGLITTNGILYELGVINQGFDNDLDFVPDYNAWLQPIGDASYNPGCFRIVRVSSILTVTRSGGNPDMILHTSDLNPHPLYGGPLYFTNLPPDNTGTRGEVYYTFQAMSGPCSTAVSPYQEVASGYDNEKFNGDYGTAIPPVGSYAPKVTIDKSSNPNVIPLGGTTTYRIPFANTGTSDAGMGLSTGGTTPLVISDTVPDGMQYVGGSATYDLSYSPNTGVTRRYSTDSGVTWSLTDPGTVLSTWPDHKVILQWWLNDALPAGSSGSYAQYQATVPVSYSGPSFIENCADSRFGEGIPFDRACATVMIQGANTLGDYVWRDENRNTLKDDGATGISGVTVSLYWDENDNGQLDEGELLIASQETSGATEGNYDFTQLPDARYIVTVDTADGDIPVGYYATTATWYAVNLNAPGDLDYNDADFGFGPSLTLDKQLISGDPAYEGDTVIFHIDITNHRPGDGNPPGPCMYTVWGNTYTNGSGNRAWTNPQNIVPAPDALYASAPFKNVQEEIAVTTWNLGGSPSGTIQKVEALVPLVVYPTLAGTFNVQVIRGATTYDHVYDAATLADGTLAVDVTGDGTWSWSDFTGNSTSTSIKLIATKAGNPPGHLDVDAVGYRITTNQQCGNPADTMNPVPLTDTFDPTKLEFLSATPPAMSVSGGTITWANVGPIYAGQTKEVLVRFRALQPPDSDVPPDGEPDPTTHQNCASTSGAQFQDGTPVNSAGDCVTHTINPAGTIGDLVWADNNNSGGPSMDDGDIGLPNVTVRLYDCGPNGTCEGGGGDDILVQTTNTDQSGWYLFRGVRDTNRPYQVIVDTSTLPGGASGWTCTYDDSAPYNSQSGPITIDYDNGSTLYDDYLNADFSYHYSGQYLFGTIWHDRNNSATPPPPDCGEEWLAGVRVDACRNSNCQSQCTAMTTNANGYFFTTLNQAGTWYVCVNATSGPLGTGTWSQTWDSDGLGTPNRVTVNVPSGSCARADFSYRRTDTILLGDTVYTDWDSDGTQDAGEEGISGVTVRLYLDDGDGVYESGTDVLWQTTSTNASGWYNFSVTPGGDYLVVLDQTTIPTGYRQTQDPDESGLCTVCNGYSDVQNQAATDLTQDFGYQPVGTGSIGDFVWRDLDHDGVQDGGAETGIANITVRLYEDSNGNGVIDAGDALVATTSTDADGNYLFTGLYVGTASNPARYLVDVDTTDPDLPLDGSGNRYILSTGNDPKLVTLTPTNKTYLDADFGFTPGGVIGDYIWQDNDADGIPDLGEPGISGVTVRLYNDVNGNRIYDPETDTLYATDTTDADGLYEFVSLPAGNYVVVVDTSTLPAGFTQTGDPDLTGPCSGATCDSQSGLYLYPGQVDRSRDFGYKPEGIIGDTLWMDVDVDGGQDAGEPGVPYITVRLYSNGPDGLPNTADDVLVGTTETDSDGKYIFGSLSDGGYNVRVDTTDLDFPPGLTLSYDPDEPNPCTICDNIGLATLSPGNRTNLTRDFGYRYGGAYSLSGYVFYDEDNDGGYYAPASGDLPYQGITIYLYNSDRLLIGSTTTDASGYYAFNNLPNGNYYVSLNPSDPKLAGMTMTSSPNELPGKCTACLNYGYPPLTTINNASVSDVDFGFYSAMDFGDLPDTYKTKLVSEGARHTIGNLYLGGAPDGDGDSLPDVSATSDDTRGIDDEDGVVQDPNNNWSPGNTAVLTITVTGNNGYLVAFFDWNEDGDFGEANEVWDFGPQTNGVHTLQVTVPITATMTQYVNARFRLYDGKPLALSPQGLAYNGEVEDYRWPIYPTAVRLLSFAARGQAGGILVTWETASEVNNLGFNLYHRPAGTQALTCLNEHLIRSPYPGQSEGAAYSFLDGQAMPGGTYEYFLESVDLSGARTQYGPIVARALYAVFLPLVVP